MFGESCSSSYTEQNKIEFAFFGLFYNFISNLQVAVETQQGVKNHFARRHLELFEPHKSTLAFSTKNPTRLKPMHRDAGGAGELAAGEGAPELGNKRHLAAIRRTRARLGVVAGPVMSPVSGSGRAVEARPRRSYSGEGRSGAEECVARLGGVVDDKKSDEPHDGRGTRTRGARRPRHPDARRRRSSRRRAEAPGRAA
jgi:hypothetical protein